MHRPQHFLPVPYLCQTGVTRRRTATYISFSRGYQIQENILTEMGKTVNVHRCLGERSYEDGRWIELATIMSNIEIRF